MPTKNPKKCAHSHQHQHNHSQSNPTRNKDTINSISNLVSKSPSSGSVSATKHSKQAEPQPAFLTRCPHVCLSANFYLEDLNQQELLKLKSKQRQEQLAIEGSLSEAKVAETPEQMDTNESTVSSLSPGHQQLSQLVCDECEQTRNLWLCLREDCLYVGCGGNSKDENSFKHSTGHAQNTFHPLAINLATRAIWCEFCNNKIVPEKNNPPFHFQTRKQATHSQKQHRTNQHDKSQKQSTSETRFDDLELISYLDQEHNRANRLEKIFRLNKRPRFKQSSNFLFNYEDENDEEDEEDEEENGDRLNNYFMYDEDENKRTGSYKNGQVGLDNLGNTCYMASAIQSLSNCAPMTGYFLECSDYIHMRIFHKSNYFDSFSAANGNSGKTGSATMLPCLSLSYMKLMRQLWEDTKKPGKGNRTHRFTSYSPNEFVQVVKYLNPMFRGYMQHDSQEFLIYLMDQLHEELKRPVYTVEAVDSLLPLSSESEDGDERSDGSSSENENTDKYRKTTPNSSIEVDSGIHRLSIKSSATQSSLGSTQTANTDGDNESADSFETAIASGSCQRTSSSHSDFSDNFLDAAEGKSSISVKSQTKSKDKKGQRRKREKRAPNPVYTSAISDIFEGKLINQVQCLECQHLSTTTESFMHLSLPIPTKEYMHSLQQRAIDRESQTAGSGHGQGWIGWMADIVKGYLWTQTIRLEECLQAFFSDSDLRGDNMYSCEKCKKLTNGVKYSKVLELPEILIIHLKRFRHDSMFSTGKISSYVSFPLEELEMRPYLHISDAAKEKSNTFANRRETQYELNSIICHYGSANGGHYIGYGRNYLNDEWYEYDDSYCKRVDTLTVQNLQAYVLFYKRKSSRIDHIKDQLRSQIISRTSLTLENSLLQSNYVSKQWLQKLKYFADPGPIDNTDFLCRHNLVQPCFWANIESLVLVCSTDTWLYLVKMFGIKRLRLMEEEEEGEQVQNLSCSDSETSESDSTFGVCNYLYPCRQCQVDDELMKQRQTFEKNEFLRLTEKNRLTHMFHQNSSPTNPYKSLQQQQQQSGSTSGIKLYAISTAWFKRWEQFVQFKHCPQKHQIPGPITNNAICNQQLLKSKVYQLNKSSNHYKLTEEVWEFLHGIYGGGPTLQINGPSMGARQSLRTMSTSSTSSMK